MSRLIYLYLRQLVRNLAGIGVLRLVVLLFLFLLIGTCVFMQFGNSPNDYFFTAGFFLFITYIHLRRKDIHSITITFPRTHEIIFGCYVLFFAPILIAQAVHGKYLLLSFSILYLFVISCFVKRRPQRTKSLFILRKIPDAYFEIKAGMRQYGYFVKYSLILLHIAISQIAVSQVHIIDEIIGTPVPNVYILSKDRNVLGISDLNGNFSRDEIIDKLWTQNKTVILSHISYFDLELNLDTLYDKENIKIKGKVVHLNEITINSKNTTDYIALKGIFRSYLIEDGIPKFYSDGLIEYFVPIKKSGVRLVKYNMQEYRNIVNETFIEGRKKRNISISTTQPGVPYIYSVPTIEYLAQKHEIVTKGKDLAVVERGDTLGEFKSTGKTGKWELNVNLYSRSQRNIEKRYFDHDFKKLCHSISEVYSENFREDKREPYYLLENKKEYRHILFKHKKEDDFHSEEVFSEFYIQEKSKLSNSQYQKSGKFVKFKDVKSHSYYTDEYWNEFDSLGISSPPLKVQQMIDRNFHSR